MAMTINIDKFVTSLIESTSGINQIIHMDLLNALKAQGLEYKNGEIIKTQRRIAAEAKEALYDKPAWSEEDEEMFKSIIATCELAEQDRDSSPAKHLLEMQTNWLKSLKDRVRLQNLTFTNEELAQAKKDAYNDTLDKIEYNSGEPTFDDGWSAAIWYLKKRNIQPQPKQEWSEEDEENLISCIDAINKCYKWDKIINWLKSLKERLGE